MARLSMRTAWCMWFAVAALFVSSASADATLDKLIAAGSYKEALDYADNNIPAPSRTGDVWAKLGQANLAAGLAEKALACFLVAQRLNPNEYAALIGAAKIYNKMNQPEDAVGQAKKALEQNFTAEASWEFASACIKLKRTPEAKKALEKVIESDPNNVIANRELGAIYFTDKQYAKAVGLLQKSYAAGKDPETALRIGQAYREIGNLDSALMFIETALSGGLKSPDVVLDLARIYFGRSQFEDAAKKYDQADGKVAFTPMDHFQRAVAEEQTKDQRGALAAYDKAVAAFGNTVSKEAIQANMKVAAAANDAKQYDKALARLLYVQNADKDGKIVPNINFFLADVYQALGNQPQAIASLEKAIARDSKNYEAYARLAGLYEKSGQADKARKTYETMMSLSPNDPKVFLILGKYDLSTKKYQDALNLLLKSDALAPSAEAEEGIASAALQLNQWNRALEAAKSAIDKNKDLVDSRIILAKGYLRAEEYADAKKQLEVLTAQFPKQAEYWAQLAQCCDALKDAKCLSDADRKTIELDRNNVPARIRLARYLQADKQSAQAYEQYAAISMLDPNNGDVLLNLYTLGKELGKKAEAIIYLKKFLVLNPKDAERTRDLGDMQYEQKDFDGALASFRQALKIDPGVKGFYKRYAELVLMKGEQGEVIKALTSLIKAGDADMSAYTTLGTIYEKQNNFRAALDIYRQALAIEPQNAELLASYAACQAKVGDINGAIITYEQAVMMNNKARDEYKSLGDLYASQNKMDQAMKAYMTYLDKGANDQAIALKVGNYAVQNKKFDMAVKYLAMVKGEAANGFDYLVVYGQACFYQGKFDEAAAALVRARELGAKQPAQLKGITMLIAQACEKLGKNVDAARMYAEYGKLAGGKDVEAAYKSAFLQEQANPDAAVKIYEANTKLFAGDPRNYLRLGLMYSKNKNTLANSIAMLKKAAALADTVPQVWLELAGVYGKLDKEDEELDAYKKYVKADPQNVLANKRIGIILMTRNQVTNGMVYLETANAIAPDDGEVMAALANGYIKTNRAKEAVDLLSKVKTKQPNNLDIRYSLFEQLRDAGRLAEAEKEIEGLIALKRDNLFLKDYAQLLVQEGKTKEAMDKIEDILATEAENTGALMLKAMILRLQKKYTEAIEVYKEISYIEPENAEALYERAETHMLESKVQWATTFYQRALRADPQYCMAEIGLAKIAKLGKRIDEYKQHVQAAYKICPNEPAVKTEYGAAMGR